MRRIFEESIGRDLMSGRSRITAGVVTMLWLFGLLSCWSCAPKKIVPTPPLPSAEEVIHRLQQEYPTVRTLQAWGKIKWKGQDNRSSAEHAILLQRPDTLRMEGLSFLGTSIYTLIIQNDEIILFVPSEKSVYRGAASPPNMERLFSLPFTAEEALSILCGRVPLCPHLEAEIHKDGDLFVLELVCLFNRWHQRISLDPFQLDPIELHITDHLGRVILNVTWSDFHSLGETRIPTQIQVEMPLKGNHLRLTYKELELNLPLSDERFHLQLPQDTEIHAL